MAPGPMLSFRASSHEYLEKFNTSAALTFCSAAQSIFALPIFSSSRSPQRVKIW